MRSLHYPAMSDTEVEQEERPIPPCPICSGPLTKVYEKFNQLVIVCED